MFDEDYNGSFKDNSEKENFPFTLEAKKWINAVSAAYKRAQMRCNSKDSAVFSMVSPFVLSTTLLILLSILQLIKSLVFLIENNVKKNKIKLAHHADSTNENFMTKVDDYVDKSREEPFRWKSIFVNDYGRPREIWQLIYLFIFIFLIAIAIMFMLGQYWPEHFRIYKDSILVAGGISLFCAFTSL